MAAKYFSASPSAMHRASIEAAVALMSSGNSRNTKRTLPGSIYFDRSIGKAFPSNAAQCGQPIEAYSTMVTGAFAGPSAMSGSSTAFAASAAVTFLALASCARASPVRSSDVRVASTASERVAAKARRRWINMLLPRRRLLVGQFFSVHQPWPDSLASMPAERRRIFNSIMYFVPPGRSCLDMTVVLPALNGQARHGLAEWLHSSREGDEMSRLSFSPNRAAHGRRAPYRTGATSVQGR